jgi:hypothetical protein
MLRNNKRLPGVSQAVKLPTANAQRSTLNDQLSTNDDFHIGLAPMARCHS